MQTNQMPNRSLNRKQNHNLQIIRLVELFFFMFIFEIFGSKKKNVKRKRRKKWNIKKMTKHCDEWMFFVSFVMSCLDSAVVHCKKSILKRYVRQLSAVIFVFNSSIRFTSLREIIISIETVSCASQTANVLK